MGLFDWFRSKKESTSPSRKKILYPEVFIVDDESKIVLPKIFGKYEKCGEAANVLPDYRFRLCKEMYFNDESRKLNLYRRQTGFEPGRALVIVYKEGGMMELTCFDSFARDYNKGWL